MAYAFPVQVLHNFCIMMNFCDDCYFDKLHGSPWKDIDFYELWLIFIFCVEGTTPFWWLLGRLLLLWLLAVLLYWSHLNWHLCEKIILCFHKSCFCDLFLSADPKTNFFFLVPPNFVYRTCLEFAEICRQVDIPPGVLNIVTGLGSEAGAPLASHPHVDKVLLSQSFHLFQT